MLLQENLYFRLGTACWVGIVPDPEVLDIVCVCSNYMKSPDFINSKTNDIEAFVNEVVHQYSLSTADKQLITEDK